MYVCIFLQVLVVSTGGVFRRINNEKTKTMISYIYLYKQLEAKQVGVGFIHSKSQMTHSKT